MLGEKNDIVTRLPTKFNFFNYIHVHKDVKYDKHISIVFRFFVLYYDFSIQMRSHFVHFDYD